MSVDCGRRRSYLWEVVIVLVMFTFDFGGAGQPLRLDP